VGGAARRRLGDRSGSAPEREATLDPDDPASIEYEQLAGSELQAATLTHRDYVVSQANSPRDGGGDALGPLTEKERDR
jgi:hypothetical protein